ncbi:MAG: polyphosphate kinase 1 [Bacteroidales bacterium]|nr:polyphosphate kinase 1 [Bacteroidales bacterium]
MERRMFTRDISWLSFNYRVLMEAKDESLPLFERIKFLSIYSSNLEEFYRVRVSEHRQALMDKNLTSEQQESALCTLKHIDQEVKRQLKEFDSFFENDILKELARHRIYLYNDCNVESFHKDFISTFFKEEVFPFLEPMIILKNQVHNFLRDNRLYMAIKVVPKNGATVFKDNEPLYFVIKVPYSKVPRFVELPSHNGYYYLMFLEDIIEANLNNIFPGFNVEKAYTVRVSRDADFLIDFETTQNLVEEIRRHVRKRKIGVANRFVYDNEMPQDFLNYLCDSYGISNERCIAEGRHLHLEDLIKMPNPVGATLTERLPEPLRVKEFDNSGSIFKVIKKKDMLLQLPYQSFEYLLRFLNEAAFDPGVEEIKLTQYRVAENSAVINRLISASQNGKKVTVFVELKARFDEENNFDTSERMKKAGIRIIYSLPKLKVHAKMILVLRKTDSGNLDKCYACLSTGNFNEKTAKIYSDMVLLTNRNELINEMDSLFNMLENGVKQYDFKHLLVSQFNMVDEIKNLVDFEINQKKQGKKARIILKMNGLQDSELINLLYDASEAGVGIDLIVRGICCLVPNQPYSKNIKITRIVDSFLEHSRIWYFYAGGEEKVFMTSADWMKRNISRRIETAFPVWSKDAKDSIINALMIQLSDNVKACWIDENLHNIYKKSNSYNKPTRAQRMIYETLKQSE